ncbi:hypothetical protein GGX14DRAFT_572522 [Mycena pura]|uniref:MYND-type domain-containing protein n=1 Tax=Mycena pura TaxID=153505 RepID=A0AAD6V1J6_9AGAR|nr:hypothetical protein GGX14DRAFT_572522 [Mycena pura]
MSDKVPQAFPDVAETASLAIRWPLDLATLTRDDIALLMTFPCPDPSRPIESRLAQLLPCEEGVHGLFLTAGRVNHTCYSPLGHPNAIYGWLDSKKVQIIHALEDIAKDEEITVSYLGPALDIGDPAEHLREKYGFDCGCAGCRRPRSDRLASMQRTHAFVRFRDALPGGMIDPEVAIRSPVALLEHIEHNTLAICEEGYPWAPLASGTHDGAAFCAVYGDPRSVVLWQALRREVLRVIYGSDHAEYIESANLVLNPRRTKNWNMCGVLKKSMRGPCPQLLAVFNRIVWASQPAAKCANRDCSKFEATDGSNKFARCRPCGVNLGLDFWYCTKACQTADWKAEHKKICGSKTSPRVSSFVHVNSVHMRARQIILQAVQHHHFLTSVTWQFRLRCELPWRGCTGRASRTLNPAYSSRLFISSNALAALPTLRQSTKTQFIPFFRRLFTSPNLHLICTVVPDARRVEKLPMALGELSDGDAESEGRVEDGDLRDAGSGTS